MEVMPSRIDPAELRKTLRREREEPVALLPRGTDGVRSQNRHHPSRPEVLQRFAGFVAADGIA